MDGVVLVGNPPFMPTGYGKQLNYIGQYLKNQYKVLHVSDFGYDLNSFQFNGVEVAPIESKPGNLTNHYLKATIDSWLERENIDRWVLIALGDLHKWGELFADSLLRLLPQSIAAKSARRRCKLFNSRFLSPCPFMGRGFWSSMASMALSTCTMLLNSPNQGVPNRQSVQQNTGRYLPATSLSAYGEI